MKKLKFQFILLAMIVSSFAVANNLELSGVVTEKHNKGFKMVGAKVELIDAKTNEILEYSLTDKTGKFFMVIQNDQYYKVRVVRKNFLPTIKEVDTETVDQNNSIKLNIELERKPGYVFDVTLTNGNTKGKAILKSIKGAKIEIYNNTTRESELVFNEHKIDRFDFVFESENHYTIMIRKQGFFNKRIEAFVDVKGCILCFDGLDIKGQEVIGEVSEDFKRGTFLADIALEPIEVNKTIDIENIYYDYNNADIRPDAAIELDKLTTILRDNQHVVLEMGSHTDARGDDRYNLKLSDARAKAAVGYLTSKAGINAARMTWKGYGESQLINSCENQVDCPEALHQENRRTTLKIIGLEKDPLADKSLKEIIENGQIDLLETS